MCKRELIIKNTFIYILLLLLIGCSPVYIKIGREYKENNFDGKKLGVIIYKDTISIKYKGDVENEFGKGNTNELIKKYFYTYFPKYLQEYSVFSEAFIEHNYNHRNLKKVTVVPASTRGYAKKFFMPDKGEKILLNSVFPDYVLILEGISISSEPTVNLIMIGLVPVAGVPSKPLTYRSRYVLWDNIKGKMAGYGNCQVSISTGVAVTMDTWHMATEAFAQHILSDKRLQYPEMKSFEIEPVEISDSQNAVGCLYNSESESSAPIAIKSKDNKQMFMNINGKTLVFNLDTSSNVDEVVNQLTYSDTVKEVYIVQYGRVELSKNIKSQCDESDDNPKMVDYTGTLSIMYAGIKTKLDIRGTHICEE